MVIKIERLLTGKQQHLAANKPWLALTHEDIIDPAQPIIDTHHHLYDRAGHRFMLEDLLEDVNSGHNIRGSVFIDSNAMYRRDGSDAMAPVGEVEFANGVAAMCASGTYGDARLCAGIVGFADLTLGSPVGEVLDAELAAGGGRYRGIRVRASFDADPSIRGGKYAVPKGLMQDSDFLKGFAELASRGLTYDAWVYHPQLLELRDLARQFPDTPIMLNHVGAPLVNLGNYATDRDQAFSAWRLLLSGLAECPNVYVKLGGLASPFFAFGFNKAEKPPSSAVMAAAWAPYFSVAVDLFGPERCMFQSNFPPDKQSASYAVLWNAFKRFAAPYSTSEKMSLFYDTAVRAYRLNLGDEQQRGHNV